VNRRLSAVTVAACALITLTSCATFDQNEVAARIDDQRLTPKDAEALAATGDTAATGDELRAQITKWIRVTVLETSTGAVESASPPTSEELDNRYAKAITAIAGDSAKALYDTGVSGSPVVCLAAITTATLDDANNVLAQLDAGTPFADAARANSTDSVIAQSGGVVMGGANGDQECLDPATVNPAVVSALQGIPVGQPIAADLDSFSAVLMLRPFEELQPVSKSLLATSSVSQEQLDAIVDAADIYVDPRYGRWDPATGSVVALSS
jgi:hypothetical protein